MKIFVAMSGGVDSSVTAALLKERGYQVAGGTMLLWGKEACAKALKSCCGEESIIKAKAVCDELEIPHYAIDMHSEFKDFVINDFVEEYKKGRTPNPCIRCNEFIKFKFLLEKAASYGCSHLATGHYAKIEKKDDNYYLKKGDDPLKDQSYFLYPIRGGDLSKMLFPLADLKKEEVRVLAARYKLPTASQPESQDVCFVDEKYPAFLEKNFGLKAEDGDITYQGRVVGKHTGLYKYTIGQRRGVGVALNDPVYVKELDVKNNTLILGNEEDLYSSEFTVNNLNILAPDLFSENEEYNIKVRYRSKGQPGRFSLADGKCLVRLTEPERGITPGQSAVFYKDDVVVAGGIIG